MVPSGASGVPPTCFRGQHARGDKRRSRWPRKQGTPQVPGTLGIRHRSAAAPKREPPALFVDAGCRFPLHLAYPTCSTRPTLGRCARPEVADGRRATLPLAVVAPGYCAGAGRRSACSRRTRPARPSEAETAAKVDAALLRDLAPDAHPPALVDDETFLRRVSLDLTGKLPDPDALRRFVADPAADKRARVVDALLKSDAYAVNWGRYWRDTVTYHTPASGNYLRWKAVRRVVDDPGAHATGRGTRSSPPSSRPAASTTKPPR